VVRGTAARWDLFVDQWRTPLGALDQFGPRDALNSIAVLSRVAIAQRYGVGIPGGVIGVTFFEAQAGAPAGNSSCPLAANVRCPTFGDVANHDVDIALISDVRYTLDEEAAYLSQNGLAFPLVVSMRQVLLHELGHAHGMQHESRFPAVMNPSQLPFRGIDLTSDDVGAARAYLPMLATQVDDLAVMGFAFNAGAYQGAQVQGNAGLRAGVDVFTARAGAFNGSEDVSIVAQNRDDAGNASTVRQLDGQTFDTTAPVVTITRGGSYVITADHATGSRNAEECAI
jgi:hypothetical protein